ncbi:MAG: RIP metalloprotease RseP [Acidobacteriota bacterium]|nr:RIP metalloprotease RseP [Acidobacteriota bacterium]
MAGLTNMATDIVVVAVVLGFMIFVHELGHFVVAKHFGVRAPVFSIGFGKRLWGFKRGGTDYRISLLPLGGYVKMDGEDPTEANRDDPGNFLAKSRWQRFLIAVAGPSMNILTALILLAVLYKFHYEKPVFAGQPARVGDVEAGSPAAKAGIKRGDLIVRFGGREHPTWEDVELNVAMTTRQSIPLEVERDGKLLAFSLTPKAEGADQMGYAGLGPCWPSVVGQVEPGLPASRAHLMTGDKITAVDGVSVPCFQSMSGLIQERGGKAVTMTLVRQGKQLQVAMDPVKEGSAPNARWIVGIAVRQDTVVTQLPIGQAMKASWSDNVQSTVVTFEALKRILTRKMSAKSLSGPVGIAQLSGSAYREGMVALLSFVAFISLQLGIFNLLPIPMLDGGMILMLFAESVMQRDLSLQFKERVVQAGIFLLLLLVVFVTYNDIIKAIGHY